MSEKQIEVLQHLHLNGQSLPETIRGAILEFAREPWSHAPEHEAMLRKQGADQADVIVLVRQAFDGIDESALVLWEEEGGYYLANIVPRNDSELGITRYNLVLRDFIDKVANPASLAGGFDVATTVDRQSLEDWLSEGPATALRRFSVLANKSSGSVHPMDRERWFTFLIAVHKSADQLDTDQLVRWLVEVEGWSVSKAHSLASEYELAQDLLVQYDNT